MNCKSRIKMQLMFIWKELNFFQNKPFSIHNWEVYWAAKNILYTVRKLLKLILKAI